MAGRGRLDRRAALGIMGKMAGIRALAQTSQIYVGKPPPGVITRVGGGGVVYPASAGFYEPWRGHQGDATVLTDFSGNGNHGALATSPANPSWITDIGLRFDGSDDYVTATLSGVSGSLVTVSAVFKVSGANRCLASAGTTNTDWQIFTQVNDLYFRSVFPGSNNVIDGLYVTENSGKFAHLVCVANGTSGSIYVNGVLTAGPTTVTTGFDQDPTLWIGQLGTDIYFLNGDIALLSVHQAAWDEATVLSAYAYAKTLPAGISGDLP